MLLVNSHFIGVFYFNNNIGKTMVFSQNIKKLNLRIGRGSVNWTVSVIKFVIFIRTGKTEIGSAGEQPIKG